MLATEGSIEQGDLEYGDWDDIPREKAANGSPDKPTAPDLKSSLSRKLVCRYGRGCTHMSDPVHRERFRHPPTPILSHDLIRSNYMCNECGAAFSTLVKLQYHLQRKTAWSNASLVGCRVSCLVDNKEWHEGLITHFHRSGKHCVEFRIIGEKRWLNMNKVAFYVIDRRRNNTANSELKEIEGEEDDMSTEEWVYIENISLDYAFAQSVLFKIYGTVVQETGHRTKGHLSLTEDDRETAKTTRCSLLYGELLPRGVNKALASDHLNALSAKVLFDLGMGTGKVAIQAFLQFRNLQYVYGIELSVGRYNVAEEAVLKMISLLGADSYDVDISAGQYIRVTEMATEGSSRCRVLHLCCGNMLEVKNIREADIVMMETDVPSELHGEVCSLLNGMKEGSRALTYHDMRKLWESGPHPFKQMDVNRLLTDRFPTSWSVQRGHHFFLWTRAGHSTKIKFINDSEIVPTISDAKVKAPSQSINWMRYICFGRKKPKEIEAEKVIPYNVNKTRGNETSPRRLESFIPIKPPTSAGQFQQEECSVEFDSQEKWSPPPLSPRVDAENMHSPSLMVVDHRNKNK